MILFIALLTLQMSARAEEQVFPMPAHAVKAGDAVTFSEDCSAKNVPVNQEGVKIEAVGTTGKVMIGAPWTGVRVSKGNEAYNLRVVHRDGEDPVELVKRGQFTTTKSGLGSKGCQHTRQFKLYSPDAPPPCGADAGAASGAPTGR